ncbi:MAG TPA: hypothetical protein VGZ00_01630 [Candidatus Baltobacteraceae bacterium]|jgi:hypothetical protein|nr:hypothetical protein [Candidatus Baltobacteraceae bacterium]
MSDEPAYPQHPAKVTGVQNRFLEGGIGEGHFHEGDVRVGIAAALFVVLLVVGGLKLHYASAANFQETCAIDQFFDPILSGIAGALTTIIGFYFGERRGRK